MSAAGVLLAAGGGRRMGTPKALLRDERGVPFLDRALGVLLDGGCDSVVVVLGAAADEARSLLDEAGWTSDEAVAVVESAAWESGMGASLRTGLEALPAGAELAVVTLVDLPDVTSEVVGRLLSGVAGRATLARAAYAGRPGHPVLLGRDHWAGVAETASGDRGARDYLAAHPVTLVECGDLATGRDVDHPSDLGPAANARRDA
jgi:molybdenum cofactor cytidylyltransferase/nicotine blue oxidoreductase